MNNQKFGTVMTYYRYHGSKFGNYEDCYNDALDQLESRKDTVGVNEYAAHCVQVLAEMDWYRNGSPYFKIWPNICEAMKHTSLRILGKDLRSPFDQIEVRLPPKVGIDVDGIECTGIFCGIHRHRGKTVLVLTYTFVDKDGMSMQIVVRDNETVEDIVINRDMHSYVRNSRKFSKSIGEDVARIVVCTLLFAVNSHELVMPDIPREVLHVKGKNKRQRILDKKRVDDLLKKNRGWTVGGEIDLPRPLVVRDGYSDPTGRELTHGHIRSGHMRMQPCGKENSERKLIFVPPCVVRGDLPMKSHGYRVRDKVLAG